LAVKVSFTYRTVAAGKVTVTVLAGAVKV